MTDAKIGRELGFRPKYGLRDSVRRAIQSVEAMAGPRRERARSRGPDEEPEIPSGRLRARADRRRHARRARHLHRPGRRLQRAARPARAVVLVSGFAFIAFYLASLAVLRRLTPAWLRFLIRTGSVQLTFLQIYKTPPTSSSRSSSPGRTTASSPGRQAILGFQPLVAIQKFYTVRPHRVDVLRLRLLCRHLPRPRRDHLLQARRGGQRGLSLPARPGQSSSAAWASSSFRWPAPCTGRRSARS